MLRKIPIRIEVAGVDLEKTIFEDLGNIYIYELIVNESEGDQCGVGGFGMTADSKRRCFAQSTDGKIVSPQNRRGIVRTVKQFLVWTARAGLTEHLEELSLSGRHVPSPSIDKVAADRLRQGRTTLVQVVRGGNWFTVGSSCSPWGDFAVSALIFWGITGTVDATGSLARRVRVLPLLDWSFASGASGASSPRSSPF